MRSKGRDSRGSRRTRTPQADTLDSGRHAHNQAAKGRSRDPPARRGQAGTVSRLVCTSRFPHAEVTPLPADVQPGGEALINAVAFPAGTVANAGSCLPMRRTTCKDISYSATSISAEPTILHLLEGMPSRSTTQFSAAPHRATVESLCAVGRGRTSRRGSPPPCLFLLSLRSRRRLPSRPDAYII